jgi:hypothetical protein
MEKRKHSAIYNHLLTMPAEVFGVRGNKAIALREIEEMETNPKSIPIGRLNPETKNLNEAFVWASTNSGHMFWQTLNRAIYASKYS